MPKQPRIDRWVRLAAVLVGLAVAAAAVLSWRIPPGSGTPGLDLTVTATRVGALDVSPVGPVLRAGTMTPGTPAHAAHGKLDLTNPTAAPLAVRLRGLPSSRHIDRALWVDISAGQKRLVRAPLASLRDWTKQRLVLPPAARRSLELRAWLPRSAHPGWAGRIETVALEVRGRPLTEKRASG